MSRLRAWFTVGGVVAVVTATAVVVGGAAARATAAIKSVAAPVVSGTAEQGSTLTTTRGDWSLGGSPLAGGTYSFSWRRCGPSGGNCTQIIGEAAHTYVLSAADVGHTIRSHVKAAASGALPGQATSAATAVVKAAGAAPSNTATPTVSGEASVGQTLTADPGQWSGLSPIKFAFQWQRCNSAGTACGNIPGATGRTISLDRTDLGKTLRVRVQARNARGAATASSAASAVVTNTGQPKPPPPPPPPPAGGAVDVNSLASTDRLILAQVKFSPSVLATRDPFTMRVEVTDSKGTRVSGALVYAQPLPYGLIYPVAEVPTDSSGWATLTLRPTANLPVGKNGALVIFLRARRGSDNLLGGISNRRLVQVSLR